MPALLMLLTILPLGKSDVAVALTRATASRLEIFSAITGLITFVLALGGVALTGALNAAALSG